MRVELGYPSAEQESEILKRFERAEPLARELYSSTSDTEDVFCTGSADHYLADCAMDRRDYTLAEDHRRSELETALRAAGERALSSRPASAIPWTSVASSYPHGSPW